MRRNGAQRIRVGRQPRTRISHPAALVAFSLLVAWITAIYTGLVWFMRRGDD